jgi:hypothetical protein
MINSVKQFFTDLKVTSKYLWYLVKFVIYITLFFISFKLLNLASTVGNLLGLLILASTFVMCVIRSIRVIKTRASKLED